MLIPISTIMPNPQQPRKAFRKRDIASLANSIEEIGLVTPIVVENNGDGTYTLVSGQRRLLAHEHLKRTQIEATVRESSNHGGLSRLVAATAENVARKDMTAVEEAYAYNEMKTRGMSVPDIARSCGTSSHNIYSKLKILEFTEEERLLMMEGKIPVVERALDALLSIPSVQDRVEMAKRMANRNANGAVVIRACQQFLSMKAQDPKRRSRGPKPTRMYGTPATRMIPIEEMPEWDALYSVGKVPPWKVYTEAIMNTCDSCSLRQVASDSTCGTCPLVTMVKKTFEAVHHGS